MTLEQKRGIRTIVQKVAPEEYTQASLGIPLLETHPDRIPSIRERGIAFGQELEHPLPLMGTNTSEMPQPEDMRAFVHEVVAMGHGYNDETQIQIISAEDLAIGEEIYQLWLDRFRRPTPWFIDRDDGVIYQTRPRMVSVGPKRTTPDGKPIPRQKKRNYYTHAIVKIADLEKEQIGDKLSRTNQQFNTVEQKLPDFMDRGGQIYRPYRGLHRSNVQWGNEEGVHDEGLSLINEIAGNWTPQALADAYKVNQLQKWTPPFATPRQILIYAMFQEKQTQIQYKNLKNHAINEEGAPNVGKIYGTIDHDEGFHFAFFKAVVELLAEHDREGTIADIVYVAYNYYMPALNMVGEWRQSLKDMMDVGAYPKGMMRDQVIKGVLNQLKFLPEGMDEIIAEEFAKRPRRSPTLAAEIPIFENGENGNGEHTVFSEKSTPLDLADLQLVY